jgi:hypothetical protein
VAVHGVRVLRAVRPPPPDGPALAPCQGRQQRLPREHGAIASASGTPLTHHLPLPRSGTPSPSSASSRRPPQAP